VPGRLAGSGAAAIAVEHRARLGGWVVGQHIAALHDRQIALV